MTQLTLAPLYIFVGRMVFLILGSSLIFAQPETSGVPQEQPKNIRHERVNALWHSVLGISDGLAGLPNWSAKQTLAFVSEVYFGQKGAISDAEINRMLDVRRFDKRPFNFSSVNDVAMRVKVKDTFEDASLLFFSLQSNYRSVDSDRSTLKLPTHPYLAHVFFAKSLKCDLRHPNVTDYLTERKSEDTIHNTRWQEFVVNGFLDDKEIATGYMTEEILKNHVLVQSVLWVGREVIEEVRASDQSSYWNGPAASHFDYEILVKDFSIKEVNLEELATTDQMGEDLIECSVKKYQYILKDIVDQCGVDGEEIRLSLYWAMYGLMVYDLCKQPIYDVASGRLLSGASAEVRLAQCFSVLYEYYEYAANSFTFQETIEQPFSPNVLSFLDHEGTLIDLLFETKPINIPPILTDRDALDFMFNNLPGSGSGERNLLSVFKSIHGASTKIDIAHHFASARVSHPDHLWYPDDLIERIENVRDEVLEAQRLRNRDGPDKIVTALAEHAIEEIKEPTSQLYVEVIEYEYIFASSSRVGKSGPVTQ